MTNVYGPTCHVDGIVGHGDPSHGVMLIGIAPGATEMQTHKPLTGQSGKLLDTILKGCGWPRELTYVTNVLCYPCAEPTSGQIIECRPRLFAEIENIKPKLIVTLGKVPANVLFPEYELKDIRGAVLWSRFGCYVIPTYHPAAVLHGLQFYVHDIVRDLDKIRCVVDWPPEVGRAQVSYDIATSKTHAQWYLDQLEQSCYNYVAVDIETSQGKTDDGEIDPFSDKLLSVAVGTAEHALVIKYELAQGLVWPELNYTFHNGVFDVQGIRRFLDVKLPIVDDTMLMSYNVDERKKLHGLKPLSREYLGSGFYEKKISYDRKKGTMDALPFEEMAEYNAKDAIYTARLAKILYDKMEQDNVLNPYHELLIPAANMFADIQYRGVYIDPRQMNKLILEWGEPYLEEETNLQKMARTLGWDGKDEINLRSWQQVSRMIYKIMGLPGGPSVKESVLEEIAPHNEFVARKLCWTKLDHQIGNYVLGIRDDVRLDGRAHPSALQHGTETARLSYTRPPVQTITSTLIEETFDKYRDWVKRFNPDYNLIDNIGLARTLFAATNDDYVIVQADYKNAELWGAAAYSHDANLISDLTHGDVHRNMAATYFQKRPEEVTGLERKNSKYVTFGGLFYRGAPAIAATQLRGTSLFIVEEMMRQFHLHLHEYFSWAEGVRRDVKRTGEVVSITGRKRRLRAIIGPEAHNLLNAAVNFPIQNLASDTTLSSAIELHPKLKELDCHILFLVHDAIIFEFSKKHLTKALILANQVMITPRFPGTFSVPVEWKIGKSWGDVIEIDFKDGVPILNGNVESYTRV